MAIGSACWWIIGPRMVGLIFSTIVWPMIRVFDALRFPFRLMGAVQKVDLLCPEILR